MFSDSDDQIVRLLQQIDKRLSAMPGGGSVSVDNDRTVKTNRTVNYDQNSTVDNSTTVENTIDMSEPNSENTGDTFSTGATAVVLDDTEWELIRFGQLISVVNIRSDAEIDIAYSNPSRDSSNIIRLPTKDLPFTDGSGDVPIATGFMWIRKSPNASSNPNVRIIAR